jgi:hypothetical protein
MVSSVRVHPQPNHNGHPLDGALVGAGPSLLNEWGHATPASYRIFLCSISTWKPFYRVPQVDCWFQSLVSPVLSCLGLATGFPLVSWLWTTSPGWKSKFNSVVLEIHSQVSQGPDHFGRLHLKWFKSSSTTLGPMKFPCIFQACDWTCVIFFDLKCTTFSLMIIDSSSWQWFQTPEYLASHLWKLINLI